MRFWSSWYSRSTRRRASELANVREAAILLDRNGKHTAARGARDGRRGARTRTEVALMLRRSSVLGFLVLVLSSASGAAFGAVPLYTGLGTVHHTVTARSPLAQKYFDQGLRLCYAFNHEEAIRSFREAARLDPSCAMAHWGIAYALGPNINLPVDPAREKEAFQEIQEAKRLAPKTSARERAWIDALARRFSDDPKADLHAQDQAYADAMRELAAKYPQDPDAATLYADALLGVAPWDWWSRDGKPMPGTNDAIAALQRVLVKNPSHTGANHLLIHALEESPTPGKALPAANRLAALAPNAAEQVDPDMLRKMPEMAAMEFWKPVPYYALARFQKWSEILDESAPPADLRFTCGMWHYARGVALAATGKADLAMAERDSVAAIAAAIPPEAVMGLNHAAPLLRVALDALEGQMAMGSGRYADAVEEFRAAVAAEDPLHYDEPPAWYHPTREMLGAALLKAGRPAEAETAFKEDLARYPGNGWALFGLAESLNARGRITEAMAAKKRFTRAWAQADFSLGKSPM